MAENGETEVKYKYLKIVLEYSALVNVLRYFPPLSETQLQWCVHGQTTDSVLSHTGVQTYLSPYLNVASCLWPTVLAFFSLCIIVIVHFFVYKVIKKVTSGHTVKFS